MPHLIMNHLLLMCNLYTRLNAWYTSLGIPSPSCTCNGRYMVARLCVDHMQSVCSVHALVLHDHEMIRHWVVLLDKQDMYSFLVIT